MNSSGSSGSKVPSPASDGDLLHHVDGVHEVVAVGRRGHHHGGAFDARAAAHALHHPAPLFGGDLLAEQAFGGRQLDAGFGLEVARRHHLAPVGGVVGIADQHRLDGVAGVGQVAGRDRGHQEQNVQCAAR